MKRLWAWIVTHPVAGRRIAGHDCDWWFTLTIGILVLVSCAGYGCGAAEKSSTTPMPSPSLTPPKGWSSWYAFYETVSDAKVRQQADLLVSTGLRDAGYVYVNVDGGWEGYRDSAGNIHPNSNFPDMKSLGNYLHGKGLKFGIYSSPWSTHL